MFSLDPIHEFLILLILAVFYGSIWLFVWLVFCYARFRTVGRLNRLLEHDPVAAGSSDLRFVLRTLEREGKIPRKLSTKLLRIAPVLHEGRWVCYPSNAYWDFRYRKVFTRE